MQSLSDSVILISCITLMVFLQACQRNAEPINFGKDQGYYCKMTIVDKKFGAELITDKGRVYKYDAVECMVNHLKEEDPAFHQLYAIAYDDPGKLYPVDSLHFVISSEIRSPMGANLAAYRDTGNLQTAKPKKFMRWPQLVAELEER